MVFLTDLLVLQTVNDYLINQGYILIKRDGCVLYRITAAAFFHVDIPFSS